MEIASGYGGEASARAGSEQAGAVGMYAFEMTISMP